MFDFQLIYARGDVTTIPLDAFGSFRFACVMETPAAICKAPNCNLAEDTPQSCKRQWGIPITWLSDDLYTSKTYRHLSATCGTTIAILEHI